MIGRVPTIIQEELPSLLQNGLMLGNPLRKSLNPELNAYVDFQGFGMISGSMVQAGAHEKLSLQTMVG